MHEIICIFNLILLIHYTNGLEQEKGNSSVLAME